jgi:hypothetical protein
MSGGVGRLPRPKDYPMAVLEAPAAAPSGGATSSSTARWCSRPASSAATCSCAWQFHPEVADAGVAAEIVMRSGLIADIATATR